MDVFVHIVTKTANRYVVFALVSGGMFEALPGVLSAFLCFNVCKEYGGLRLDTVSW